MVSYNDLDQNLKLCFAYCSLFPKDCTFDKDELVRSWLSQGFIKPCPDNEQSLEEVGEEYFKYLVQRCFFQKVPQYERRHPYRGFVSSQYGFTAKMHDLLHDVAIGVAKSVFRDTVFTVESKRHNLRHISIYHEVGDSFDCRSLVSHPKRARSFLFQEGGQLSKSSLKMLLTSFRMLRTLCLPNLGIDHLSDSIGELIHLRYLDLSYNKKLKHLPNSICKLHHLMILILVHCTLLEELPRKIDKLVSLRQLHIHGCLKLVSLPSGLIALTSLVNLDRVIVHRHTGGLRYLQDLDKLCGIVKVELPKSGWIDLEAIEDAGKANMWRKPKLSGMVIEWNYSFDQNDRQEVAKYRSKSVLDALKPHQNLEYLEISHYVGEMLSSWFCTLKNITELSLCYCLVEYLEDEIRGDLFFPSLKNLKLESLFCLKGWWRQEIVEETKRPHLTKGSAVHISNCPQLKGPMPLFSEVEDLSLQATEMELLTAVLIGNPNCSSSTSFSPLHENNNKLKKLQLVNIRGLTSLPEGWIKPLTCLQTLNVTRCPSLEWVSCRGLAHLTALKDLNLVDCEVTDDVEDDNRAAGMPWKALKDLEFLKVLSWDEQFLEGLQYLTSLKELVIKNWKDTEVGDDQQAEASVEFPLQALENLHTLEVGFDGKTTRLPKVIQDLPSLQRLRINECEELHLCWKTLFSTKLKWLAFNNVKSVIDVQGMAVEQQTGTEPGLKTLVGEIPSCK